ncbi:RNA polymerase sigma factor [Pseudomonas sp. ABC1]|uniref:RNA polymerase sigma factor n=1 Tax=Pseudomonas sp. ABC1 TaxID=2748080 RepID=UPI00211A2822|nr:RNA polymerase sigma factor [Pseudomonas sp. ABC1]
MFEELFMAQRGVLLRTLQRMVGNRSTAEDLLQETYLRVAAVVAERPLEHMAPFIFQTARNLALDHLRSRQRQARLIRDDVTEELLEQVPAESASPQDILENQQLLAQLDKALAGLSPRQQEAFMLNRLYGWSYAEIADHLAVSLSTVQKDLKLAMALCVTTYAKLERH